MSQPQRAERFLSNVPAEEILSNQRIQPSMAINISKSGALLQSDKPDEIKKHWVLQLRLHLPCFQKSILAQVEVVRELIKDGKYYRGVRFIYLSPEDRILLDAYTTALRVGSA